MIYCSLLSEKNLELNDALLFSKKNNAYKLLNNEKLPTELDFIFSLKNYIDDDEYYFIDIDDGKNFDLFTEKKNTAVSEKLIFLKNGTNNVSRIFCNLRDRFNFIKNFGNVLEGNFPLIIKGYFLKEIINYINLLIVYDVFYYHLDSYFTILGKLLND